MKRKVLLLMIVLVFVLSAAAPKLRLSRFTVINKSGGPIAMRLAPATSESQATYFLNIASGDRSFPTTAVYTVQQNKYAVNVYFYKETVVDGYVVSKPVCTLYYTNLEYFAPKVDLTHNNKIVVLPCNQQAEPISLGADGYWKYWYPGYVNYTDRPEPAWKWNWVPIWDYVY